MVVWGLRWRRLCLGRLGLYWNFLLHPVPNVSKSNINPQDDSDYNQEQDLTPDFPILNWSGLKQPQVFHLDFVHLILKSIYKIKNRSKITVLLYLPQVKHHTNFTAETILEDWVHLGPSWSNTQVSYVIYHLVIFFLFHSLD